MLFSFFFSSTRRRSNRPSLSLESFGENVNQWNETSLRPPKLDLVCLEERVVPSTFYTKTELTSSENPWNEITLVANVSETSSVFSPYTPVGSGWQINFYRVTDSFFTFHEFLGSGLTDANGQAAISLGILPSDDYEFLARFVGGTSTTGNDLLPSEDNHFLSIPIKDFYATELTLTLTPNTVNVEEPIEIRAQLQGFDRSSVFYPPDQIITFYEILGPHSLVEIGTGVTDWAGEAAITITPMDAGTRTFFAEFASGLYNSHYWLETSNDQRDIDVQQPLIQYSTTTVLTSDTQSSTVGESVSLNAQILWDDPIVGAKPVGAGHAVSFFDEQGDGPQFLGSSLTDSNGNAAYTINSLTEGTHALLGPVDIGGRCRRYC